LLALLFVLAALSGCGSDEISGEIPQADADELNASLDEVRTAVESSPPQCTTAKSKADQFVADVNALPADAGTELKAALRDAGDHLRVLVDEQCASTGTTDTKAATTTTPTTSSTSTTSSETTTPSTTDTTDTTDTTSTTSTTTEEQPPPGNGNGGGPPGQGGGNDGGTGGTGGVGTGDETGD
jgi:hypothetical protein